LIALRAFARCFCLLVGVGIVRTPFSQKSKKLGKYVFKQEKPIISRKKGAGRK
jgi:hypothetical protein